MARIFSKYKDNEIIYYLLDDTDYSDMEIACDCQSPCGYNPIPSSGEVVEVSDISGKYRKSLGKYSTKVVGVCCDPVQTLVPSPDNHFAQENENITEEPIDPGFTYYEKGTQYIPVAVSGRVKVKVTGLVSVGDLLASSHISGYAMAVQYDRAHRGSILGKCIEMTENEDEVIMQIFLS